MARASTSAAANAQPRPNGMASITLVVRLRNWTRPGPAWVDTVMLLNTAFGQLDIDAALAAHPSTAPVSPELVDAVLAALGGNQLEASNRPPVPSSPMLRAHQRRQGLQALGWLSQRRGWWSGDAGPSRGKPTCRDREDAEG